MMVPTTLFKSVRSSSHEQFVPTYMNKPFKNIFKLASSTMLKPVNNQKQAGFLRGTRHRKKGFAKDFFKGYTFPCNIRISTKDVVLITNNCHCALFSIAFWMKLRQIPFMSICPITKTPLCVNVAKPFVQFA